MSPNLGELPAGGLYERRVGRDDLGMQRVVGGRPTKLTDDRQARILALVGTGQFRSTAARAVGVAPETLFRWLARPEPRYRRFRQAVLQAEAAAEVRLVAQMTEAIHHDPHLALKLLGRRFTERWGLRSVGQRLEFHVGDEVPRPDTIG